MKRVYWLFALACGSMFFSSHTQCPAEITYGEKSDERKTSQEKEANLHPKHQAEVLQSEPTRKPKQNILDTCFEAMAVAGQAFGQAMNNLFRIRMPEESGWKKKEYAESTNQPISTLTPVLDNLQKVGSP